MPPQLVPIVLFAIVALTGWFLYQLFTPLFNESWTLRLVRWAPVANSKYLECEYETKTTSRRFFMKKEDVKTERVLYRGSVTVWHVYPSGRRASTSTETLLAQMHERIKWGLCEELCVKAEVLETQYKQTVEKT